MGPPGWEPKVRKSAHCNFPESTDPHLSEAGISKPLASLLDKQPKQLIDYQYVSPDGGFAKWWVTPHVREVLNPQTLNV